MPSFVSFVRRRCLLLSLLGITGCVTASAHSAQAPMPLADMVVTFGSPLLTSTRYTPRQFPKTFTLLGQQATSMTGVVRRDGHWEVATPRATPAAFGLTPCAGDRRALVSVGIAIDVLADGYTSIRTFLRSTQPLCAETQTHAFEGLEFDAAQFLVVMQSDVTAPGDSAAAEFFRTHH